MVYEEDKKDERGVGDVEWIRVEESVGGGFEED